VLRFTRIAPRDFRDLSDVVYKCQWKFRAKRAAFMVMLRARKTNVPTAFLNMALKEENPVPEIRSKNVVTGVWTCPAFAMYLSDKCKSFDFLWTVHPPPASEVSVLFVVVSILINTLLREPII